MKEGHSKVKRAVRKEQIVQAVLKIIAAGGVKSLTTASIARETGLSESNLYNHFKNKEDILIETVKRIKAGLESNVERVARISSASPIRRLRRLFILHLEFLENNIGIPRLVYSEEIHSGSEELRTSVLHAINSYAAYVELIVKQGQETNELNRNIRPASIVAMFIGLIQVMTMRWSLTGFSLPLVREGTRLWKDFLKGIEPR